MFEKHSYPLPDIHAYLARIGIKEAETPSLSFLNRIIDAHQTHIPFEDLDSYRFKKCVSLEIPALFDKMVVRRRGGFCFEHNLLLAQALRDLGFDAYTVFCRVLYFIEDKADYPPCLHCAVIVTIDGRKYFCDVGFGGPQPSAAIPVMPGNETVLPEGPWKVGQAEGEWFSLNRKESNKKWVPVVQFNLFRQAPQEFMPAALYCCVSENSLFANSLVVGIRTETGSKNIMDNVYTVRENGAVTRTELASEAETDRILEQDFGIYA